MTGVPANLPTTKEAGFPMVANNWRLVIAPKGLSAAQMSNSYRNSAAPPRYIAGEYGGIRGILAESGLAKTAK